LVPGGPTLREPRSIRSEVKPSEVEDLVRLKTRAELAEVIRKALCSGATPEASQMAVWMFADGEPEEFRPKEELLNIVTTGGVHPRDQVCRVNDAYLKTYAWGQALVRGKLRLIRRLEEGPADDLVLP
jgi:hypothetical protein